MNLISWAQGYNPDLPDWTTTLIQAQDWSTPPWIITGEPNTITNRRKWSRRWAFFKPAMNARQTLTIKGN